MYFSYLLHYPPQSSASLTERGFKTFIVCKACISLHSHHVSLVQWTTLCLPVTRDPGSKPLGGLK
jgi:hypothetical protein